MSSISKPLILPCGATIPNRLCKSAMTEGLADLNDSPTHLHNELYKTWSEGGAGLLVTGNVMIDSRYLERVGNVVVEDERHIEALTEWVKASTVNDNHLWMQISHPGRQCTRFVNTQPMAPSDVQLKVSGLFGRPRAMTEEDIQDVVRRFVTTATIAKKAGFTGIQIHSAHGYLLSQFLSPHVNKRTDQWGGALENRARLLLTIVSETRKALGDDFPIGVKLNSSDFQKGGFELEECIQVAKWLSEANIDLLEISGGTYENIMFLSSNEREEEDKELTKRTREREAFFLEYAKAISQAISSGESSMPLMITGGFRSKAVMEQALDNGDLQMIGIARPFCMAPEFPAQLMAGEIEQLPNNETELKFGNGILSRQSKVDLIKSFGAQGEAGWYFHQIIKLAEGKKPDPNYGLFTALVTHFTSDLKNNLKRRKKRSA